LPFFNTEYTEKIHSQSNTEIIFSKNDSIFSFPSRERIKERASIPFLSPSPSSRRGLG